MKRTALLATAAGLLALAATGAWYLTPGSRRFGDRQERFPRWEESRAAEAQRALDEDDRMRAVARFRELAARYPRSLFAQRGLGTALRASGEHEEALEPFRRARDLAPEEETVQVDFILALDAVGRQDEAIPEALALARRSGASGMALSIAGTLLANTGRPDEALPLLERAVERDPRNDLAWHELGFVRSQHEDGEGADEAFGRALSLQPCDLATLHAAAWNALVVLDDDDRVFRYAQQAIDCPTERAADKADFFYLRAELQLRRNDPDAAFFSLSSALEAGYDRTDWCEPGSSFVLALGPRPEFQQLVRDNCGG